MYSQDSGGWGWGRTCGTSLRGGGQARVRGEEVGGVSVAARTRARVPQHSERGRARGRPSDDEAPAEETVTLGRQVRRCVQVERGVTVLPTR